MSFPISRFLVGAVAAALVALLARRRRSLSPSGAAAATVSGAIVVGAGGWWWGVLLVAFFVSSSALGRGRRKGRVPEEVQRISDPESAAPGFLPLAARGGERDVVQVLANGGVATLFAALAALWPDAAHLLYAGFAGALAAATADTWATEIGARSRTPPRLIVGGRPVPAGTSGGVTRLGNVAAVGGAVFIAALAGAGVTAGAAPGELWIVVLGVAGGGLAGALADSVLGATVQAGYRCPTCGEPTERRVHGCGAVTLLVRGYRPIDNDLVNVAATGVGALLGVGAASLV